MKICQKCKKIHSDSQDRCSICGKNLKTIVDKNTPVGVCEVSGVDRMRVHGALEDAGIPCSEARRKKSVSSEAVTGGDLSDVVILVPYQAYDKAYDICVGIGVIDEKDVAPLTEEELNDIESKKSVLDKDAEDFMEMSQSKRTFVRIVSAILLILVFCGVIWGVDYGLEWIKGFFY